MLDAVLLHSFGGPNGPDDVLPFLRNVTAGIDIPDSRLAEVGEHYFAFGGKSPINEHNETLRAALERELAARGRPIPVVVGNRNWEPYTAYALRQLEALGARQVAVLVTSAYCAYSGCWQYREDLAGATAAHVAAGGTPFEFHQMRAFCNTPGFVAANVDAVVDAAEALGEGAQPWLVFVTHSIPAAMEAASGVTHASYREQHLDVAAEVARLVSARCGRPLDWDLVYCSRSGSPHQPWLEPDVNEYLETLAATGVTDVVLAPIGFISDHMEVVYDLDTQGLDTAKRLGLNAVRAATAGVHPAFVASLADLVLNPHDDVGRAASRAGSYSRETKEVVDERSEEHDVTVVGTLPALPSGCSEHCCQRRLPDTDNAMTSLASSA